MGLIRTKLEEYFLKIELILTILNYQTELMREIELILTILKIIRSSSKSIPYELCLPTHIKDIKNTLFA
jgi:hypothetical protein